VIIQTSFQFLSTIGKLEIPFFSIKSNAFSGVVVSGAVIKRCLFIFQSSVNCSYFSKSFGVKIESGFSSSSTKITQL